MPGSDESRGMIRAEVVSVPGELLVHWGERTSQPRSPMVTDCDTCTKGVNRPRGPGHRGAWRWTGSGRRLGGGDTSWDLEKNMVPSNPESWKRGSLPFIHARCTYWVSASSQSLGKTWKEGEARVPALKQLRASSRMLPRTHALTQGI